jgi:hypothetical protein
MRRNRKNLRLRNVHALAVARGAVEELAGAVVVAAADAVGRVPVADAALPVVAADRVVGRAARAPHAAVAVDVEKAKAVTAKADAETAEASSSRT